jgi:hypothetical protein
VTRHLTEPWAVTTAGPLRSDAGNVYFPQSFVTVEGRIIRPFYATTVEFVSDRHVEERIDDVVLALPRLS